MKELLEASRSFSNESAGANMHGCLATDGAVECYFPNRASFKRNGPLFAAASDLLGTLEMMERTFNVEEIDPLVAFMAIERARAILAKSRGSSSSQK